MATSPNNGSPTSKTDFVNAYLDGNPTGGAKAVNEAWAAAGHEGKISDTLVHRLRSEKGLTGNRPPGREPGSGNGTSARSPASRARPARRRGRPSRYSPAADRPATKAAPPPPPRSAAEDGGLEAEFDRLLFRVMGLGMPDVEEAIRHARRLLVLREGR
ncbi:hypothetical protein [Tautonia plasticadhaerens]|uniref:Uncharacterized protein n=1 Tax=Tautonia plasticadhaerens TaxID=2527974 RepID=A0A518HD41_9BACT|nr:hypothetical protein [Tautonia plasticadhaerens]QDV38774.1 hypothetical protein ElP_67310 [Tautonia plasticadhaerens]